jgi:hypothetical protein
MNPIEFENSFPILHFHFNEAYEWIGKQVFVKHIKQIGLVQEMKRAEKGYDLLIALDGFSLLLSKQNFAKWIELKPNQIKLPVMH